MPVVEIMRAHRVVLDPTSAQLEALRRHAGASRWAYNHALGRKVAAHRQWQQLVAEATYAADAPADPGAALAWARKQVKVHIPTKPVIQRELNLAKGDSRKGVDGLCPWWHEVSTYALQSAFLDADLAWRGWLESLAGRRKGRRVGYPRFKKRGRSRDSVRLHHDVKRPTIRPDGYRRLLLPRIGSVRVHGNLRRLARGIAKGRVVVQSVTISRHGDRWVASILTKTRQEIPERASARARACSPTRSAGRVGQGRSQLLAPVLASPPLARRVSPTRHDRLVVAVGRERHAPPARVPLHRPP